MAILSDKGLTCSDPLCKQRDFLPFHCNKCGNVFCLEHYLPDSHACPKKQAGDRRVYVCSLCLDVVRLVDLETDEDAAVRHRPQCRPELRGQREKARKGRTCPVKNCKERLTAISSYTCPNCHVDVCMKHRLKEDHNCELLKAQRKDRRQGSLIRQLSANATRAVKLRRPSDRSSSGTECGCDFAACWPPTEKSKDPKVRPWKPPASLQARSAEGFARLCNRSLKTSQSEAASWNVFRPSSQWNSKPF
ncbi:hypothetical protein Esti_001910 [Eimeria stiedai]